ncbi:MAG: tRNA1(Val) (adenine(37)-N6)-methyltransferase [Paludibacter sp.]
MGASSFSFKQFTVFHDKCAMKVGTDGVLLGGFADVKNAKTILDIGTGSGLIALMLAQRSIAQITAIDIDKDAVSQALFNVANSPWPSRIQVIESSLTNFKDSCTDKFDLIVSNPPFFTNSLKTPDELRTLARHAESDFHHEICNAAQNLLQAEGRLVVILPVVEGNLFVAYAQQVGLHCTQYVQVFPTPTTVVKRLLLEFSMQKSVCKHASLVIESGTRHEYSPEFTEMLQDFYLKL